MAAGSTVKTHDQFTLVRPTKTTKVSNGKRISLMAGSLQDATAWQAVTVAKSVIAAAFPPR